MLPIIEIWACKIPQYWSICFCRLVGAASWGLTVDTQCQWASHQPGLFLNYCWPTRSQSQQCKITAYWFGGQKCKNSTSMLTLRCQEGDVTANGSREAYLFSFLRPPWTLAVPLTALASLPPLLSPSHPFSSNFNHSTSILIRIFDSLTYLGNPR